MSIGTNFDEIAKEFAPLDKLLDYDLEELSIGDIDELVEAVEQNPVLRVAIKEILKDVDDKTVVGARRDLLVYLTEKFSRFES